LQVISDLIPYNRLDSIYEFRDTDVSLRGDVPYGYSVLLVSDSYEVTPHRDTVFVYPGVPVRVPVPDIFIAALDLNGTARIAWIHDLYDEIPLRYFLVCPINSAGAIESLRCDTVSRDNNFIDITNVSPGDEFGVIAVHLMGSKSPVATTGSLSYPDVRVQGPEYLWHKPGGNHPVIAWVPVSDPRVEALEIYRMLEGEDIGPEKIAIIKREINEFEDTAITSRGTVLYQIVPVLYNGNSGIPSEILTIRHD